VSSPDPERQRDGDLPVWCAKRDAATGQVVVLDHYAPDGLTVHHGPRATCPDCLPKP